MTPGERWDALWQELGLSAERSCFDALLARHAEPHRAYHTLEHLEECFDLLDEHRNLARQSTDIELAIWFHDAVYDPRSQDNEQQSAAVAANFLASAGAASELIARVESLILATRHVDLPATGDAQLLVDIDLGILGSEPPRFWEYERQIRREYEFVPEAEYRRARSAVLARFLQRPRIYHTPAIAAAREQRARANLAASIEQLSA